MEYVTIANEIDLKNCRRLKEKEQVILEAVEGKDIIFVDDNYEKILEIFLNG